MKNNFFDVDTTNKIKGFFGDKYDFLFEEVFNNILTDFKIKKPMLIDLKIDNDNFYLDFFDQPEKNFAENFLNVIGIEKIISEHYRVCYNKNNPNYILFISHKDSSKVYKAYYKLEKDNALVQKFNVNNRKTAYSKIFKYSFKNEYKYQYTYKYKENKYKILFDLEKPFELERLFLTKLFEFRHNVLAEDFKDFLVITLQSLISKQKELNANLQDFEIAYHEEYKLFLIRTKKLKKVKHDNDNTENVSHKMR